MARATVTAIAAAPLLLFATPADARPYLLSIHGIALAPSESVQSFSLDTWGVAFRAVCHIPPDWEITVRGAGIGGRLAGEAGHGTVYLRRRNLGELNALALIDLDGPVLLKARGPVPPTFE